MKEISLNGTALCALVDDEDYIAVTKQNWCCTELFRGGSSYICIVTHVKGTKNKIVTLANFIKGEPPEGFTWDHKNRNSLDNTRNNFRLATKVQQSINREKSIYGGRECSSKYKGVTFRKTSNNYEACIQINKKYCYLGRFSTEVEAAMAYNIMASKHYGEFAVLNEVE